MRIGSLVNKGTSVLQYQARDLLWGFAELGWQTSLLYVHDVKSADFLREWIASLDVLVFVTGGRWSVQPGLIPDDKPVWTFDQDNVLAVIKPEDMGPKDHAWSMLKRWAKDGAARGLPVDFMAPGVNASIYYPADEGEHRQGSVFIGNYYPGRDTQMLEQAGNRGPGEFLRNLYQHYRLCCHLHTDPDEVLAQFLETSMDNVLKGVDAGFRKQWQLLCHHWHRHRWVQRLTEIDPTLSLYGFGFEQWPRNHKGIALSGVEAAEVYRASKTAYFVHPLTCSHPRLFEALACGCDVLCTPTSADDLTDYFEVSGREEGMCKVDGLVGCHEVTRSHSYQNRAEQMIKEANFAP